MARPPIPEGFALTGSSETIEQLRARYGVGERAIRLWRTELGIKTTSRCAKAADARTLPLPDDFAERASAMHLAALVRHYGRNEKVIKRWLVTIGAVAKTVRAPRKPKPVSRRKRVANGPSGPVAAAIPLPLAGREQDAAHYLRRFSAVYRCGARGAAETGGKFWRCGNSILTPDELEARARRHGWDPDEWRVIGGTPMRRDALPSFPKTQLQGAGHG